LIHRQQFLAVRSPQSVGQRLFVNCTPKDANTYCKDARRDDSAFFVGSNYNIKGSGSASVGPLAP